MFGLGTPEIILIVIVILVLFGAKKIPELMQGLGKGVKEFKKATTDIEKDINTASNDEPKPKS
ncbi:MAG TPA: twin-arginine translocase TatA/TatE family subunit [Ignavibacteria bacterium]|jgi:sec-independent protein translocase protein TatA|nr:twin-arginine translocase TatA/TatE family subunit [Ignavibacteria bacterium]